MIKDLFQAIYQAGLPVFAISFILVWYARVVDRLSVAESLGEFEKEIKALAKSKDKKKNGKDASAAESTASPAESKPAASDQKQRMNPIHNKWMAFGGGFYGVVALITYARVEYAEIRDWLAQFDGFAGLINDFSIGLLIRLFIESLMNFFTAITWPVYWMSNIHSGNLWLWLIVAYGAYWLGASLAMKKSSVPEL